MLGCEGGHKKVIERLLLGGANANLQCLSSQDSILHFLAR